NPGLLGQLILATVATHAALNSLGAPGILISSISITGGGASSTGDSAGCLISTGTSISSTSFSSTISIISVLPDAAFLGVQEYSKQAAIIPNARTVLRVYMSERYFMSSSY